MTPVKIFISHNTKYVDIARSVKRSLQALESQMVLDIKISSEIAGATDWRKWIEDNVRTADIFLLLYPHASMEMGWCNYELGRFYDDKRYVVCVKNTDIPKPPPTFEPYQFYDADEAGFTKFVNELFVSGAFTNGKPLNQDIGRVTSDYYTRAKNVARELAQQFANARVRNHLYEKRVVISVAYNDANLFDAEKSAVQGNTEGLNLLGIDGLAMVNWSAVKSSLGETHGWPAELEKAMPSLTSGALPPALSPCRTPTGIYIPVIARAESVDRVLRQIVLIFVGVDEDMLRPLLTWVMPTKMPDSFKFLLRLIRMMFTARWEILEPRYQEAKYQTPSAERCAEIARLVTTEYAQMQRDHDSENAGGLDKFYSTFHRDLRDDVDTYSEEWGQLMNRLRAAQSVGPEELSRQLKDLLANNAKWLEIAGKQFTLTVASFS